MKCVVFKINYHNRFLKYCFHEEDSVKCFIDAIEERIDKLLIEPKYVERNIMVETIYVVDLDNCVETTNYFSCINHMFIYISSTIGVMNDLHFWSLDCER